MPYIKTQARELLDEPIEELGHNITNVGALNYAMTRLALKYIQNYGLNYANLASVIGTIRLVSTEIEQRLVRDYEDGKITENGDVREYLELI